MWSPEVRMAVKKGLQEAINEEIAVKEAHRSLSYALADEQNWPEATDHFKEALSYQREISARDYIQLGRLYLNNDLTEDVNRQFYPRIDHQPGQRKEP